MKASCDYWESRVSSRTTFWESREHRPTVTKLVLQHPASDRDVPVSPSRFREVVLEREGYDIGAEAVVTTDIPPFGVWVEAPARKIRGR